jgi:hypothetical protein
MDIEPQEGQLELRRDRAWTAEAAFLRALAAILRALAAILRSSSQRSVVVALVPAPVPRFSQTSNRGVSRL